MEDAFILKHRDSGAITKFKGTEKGLYVFEPSTTWRESNLRKQGHQLNCFVETVSENKARYTPREFDQAKRARMLYHSLGAPAIDKFKKMIQFNMIKNCPVTLDDIKIAEAVFGPDVATLKGKTTRKTPKAVLPDTIELPKELYRNILTVELCIDTMFVNRMPFLMGIDKSIKYRSAIYVKNMTSRA